MRSVLLIAALALTLFLAGCEDDTPAPLPTSGGAIDELMFVVDDAHVETAVSDSLLYHFFRPYPGLPQLYEPLFPMKIRAYKRYEQSRDLFNKYRHIVYVSALEEKSELGLMIQKDIGEENYRRAYSDSSFFFITERDKFAKPQLVVWMFAPTWDELFRRVATHMHRFAAEVKAVENPRISRTLYHSGKNPAISERLENAFGITMDIPGDFSIYRENDSLVWFRKDVSFTDKEENQMKQITRNIIVASMDMGTYSKLTARPDPLITRHGVDAPAFVFANHLMHQYIIGTDSSYRMHMDTIRPLYQQTTHVNGLPATEIRGLWRMEMPFMGGPFLALVMPSPGGDRMIAILGTIYAAGSDKRTLIREYETMFATLRSADGGNPPGNHTSE
jgi:hypothetical protein